MRRLNSIMAVLTAVLFFSLLSPAARAQYDYSLNYQTNTINIASNWVGNSTYVIGSNTYGNALIINSGGSFSNSSLSIGSLLATGGSNNFAVVNGGIWTNYGSSAIYNTGNQLIVSNGGSVYFENQFYIGTAAAISNTVLLNNGTLVTGDLFVSDGSGGLGNTLIVSNGSRVNVGSTMSVDDAGRIIVNGSTLTEAAFGTFVGAGTSGNQLIVTNGGTVFSSYGAVGDFAGCNDNLALIDGGTWSNSGALFIGSELAQEANRNRLTVLNGGKVFSSGATIGFGTSAGLGTGNVALVADGGIWSNVGTITVGGRGRQNQLTVSNTGAVFTDHLIINTSSGSRSNSVTVNGGNLTMSGTLTMGNSTFWGELTVTNNGTVIDQYGIIGNLAGSGSNYARVADGGVWRNTRELTVGNAGRSNGLTIAGGTVVASNAFISRAAFATNNFIRVDSGSLFVTNAQGNGTLVVSLGGANIGRGELILNGGAITVDTLLATNGANSALTFNSGILNTRATLVTNTARLVVGNGLQPATLNLLADAGFHRFANGLTITNGAALRGVGTVVGATVIHGELAPGFSAGTLVFSNDLTLAGTATLELFANASNDLVRVLGTLTYGGTLTVTNATGFVLTPGNTFDLFDFTGTPGTFAATNLPGLPGGWTWDTSQLGTTGIIAVVPEPAAAVLVLLGLVGMLLARRFFRS